MKMRIVARRAGARAAGMVHQGFVKGAINHPRPSHVCLKLLGTYNRTQKELLTTYVSNFNLKKSYVKFWCVNPGEVVQPGHGANGDKDPKVANEHSHLRHFV